MKRTPESFRMRGTLKVRRMNNLESDYAWVLETRKRITDADVLWWEFECLKIRLADDTFYTPDFGVMLADGTLEFHEVKGFWKDDARVKIKVAAERFPAKFRAITRVKGEWKEEEF